MPRVSEQSSRNGPLVSVAMITYNHEQYIAQAIESVLMQETDFPIELVIGEDCSTDGTRRIVQEYAAKHPNAIRLLLPTSNLGAIKNFIAVIEACRGQYIAFLEGDDFWTDPQKLQIQAAFLNAHSQVALCHHRVSYFDENSTKILYEFPPQDRRIELCSSALLAKGNFIQTCSLIVIREFIPKLTHDFAQLKLGDWPLCAMVGQFGEIGYIDRNMATYRLHGASEWSSKESKFRDAATRDMVRFLALKLSVQHRTPWVQWFLWELQSDMINKSKNGSLGQTAMSGSVYLCYGTRLQPNNLLKLVYHFIRAVAGSLNR